MTPVITCKNGCKNCHQSQKPVCLTTYKLISGRCSDCRHKEKQLDAFCIMACDPPQQKDGLRYQLVLCFWIMLSKARCSPTPSSADSRCYSCISSLEFFTNPYPFCKYHFSPTQPTPHTPVSYTHLTLPTSLRV